jgi:hypothetical protein
MEKEPKSKRIQRKREEEKFWYEIEMRSLLYWGASKGRRLSLNCGMPIERKLNGRDA